MNPTYFEILFRNRRSLKCETMEETQIAIASAINEDRNIAESILEKETTSNRVVTIYKPIFSAKLNWMEIPKYRDGDLLK